MKDFFILASMVLVLLFAPGASADMTLVPRELPPACPGTFGCNFAEADEGSGAFGVLYDVLPVSEDGLGLGSLLYDVHVDNTNGIAVDGYGSAGGSWFVVADVTFTVDATDNYAISGSLDATGTTAGLLDLHLFDVTNGTTVYHSLQESTGSTVNLVSTGGGNVTDSVVGSSFGQLAPGIEYKYTVQCSGEASTTLDCTTLNPVPEPGLASMFAAGVFTLGVLARRKMKKF